MAYRLSAYSGVGLDEALLRLVIDEHTGTVKPVLDQLWTYFRNPLTPAGLGAPSVGDSKRHTFRPASPRGGWYTLGQERGLPNRLTGRGPTDPATDDRARTRREVVVENDIAWRVQAMVDFMFGRPVRIVSLAPDPELRARIERVLDALWQSSGGIGLMQDMALLGHVFGWVDLAVRCGVSRARSEEVHDDALELAAANAVRIDVVDPRRGIPILDPADYRRLVAYIIHTQRELNAVDQDGWLDRALNRGDGPKRRTAAVTEILSADLRQTYENERLTHEEALRWTAGRVPVVHIQSTSQPFAYAGLGEVEPLIPLQDELNTRLSDRANRVTFQSFKMYLAKGLDGFEKMPVAPGQIWSSDNPDATVEAFGGDASSPSEDAHIAGVREAFDKISAVPPISGGVVQGKVGNLSSANALRITLMGLLAKTERKRVTYGRGIAEASRLALAALDFAGVLRTRERDRAIRLDWPDPFPSDQLSEARAAEARLRVGVPQQRVLQELGYDTTDGGVV